MKGLDTVPADQRPTTRQVNTVHLEPGTRWWGLGTLCFCSRSGTGSAWVFRRDMPQESPGSSGSLHAAGVLAVITMEARDGWWERGRATALDRLRSDAG